MKVQSLNWRIYGPLGAVVLALLCAVLFVLTVERDFDLDEAREQDRMAVQRLMLSTVAQRNGTMLGVVSGLLANPAIEAAFRARDRSRLLELTLPLFADLNAGPGITQIYFHDPDRIVFLRVHAPEVFGDRIDRETLLQAERTRTVAQGLEIGATKGLPALRVVRPWIVRGELLGYIEIGDEIGGLTGVIRETLGLHAFVVLAKDAVLRTSWEAEMRAAGRTPSWDRYPNLVLVEGTLPLPPSDIDARFASMEGPRPGDMVEADVEGERQQGETVAIRDASGEVVGEVVFLRDRSGMLAENDRDLAAFVVLFLLLGLVAWFTLRRIVQRNFVRPLAELRMVTESAGRGELIDTMLAERRDEMGDLGRAVNRMIGELRASQDERMRRIVDAAHDAVVVADANGVIVGWNSQAENIFGWPREAAIGLTLTETVIPEDQHSAHLSGMRRYREGHPSRIANRPVELTARRRNGDLFPAEVTITPVSSAGGDTFAAFIRDITDRREAETSEERFRRLVETANVVPWEASSRTTRLTYVGPQAEALLGYPIVEWYEEGFWINRVHPDDREHALTQLALAAGGGEQGEFEYRMVRKDGGVVWVRDIVVADVSDDEPVLRGFRFDITDRRRLEEELLQSQKMEAVGRLAGGIAHDFNNILTAILGYSSLVENSFPPGTPEREDVLEVQRAAGQAADLTQQPLAFAREQVIRPRVIVIDELVRRLEKMMGRLIGEDVAVVTHTSAGDAAVWVDPARFEQALVNLLFNARDAMPTGGTLTLTTAVVQVGGAMATGGEVDPGTFVMVSVADTGVGMGEEVLQHVFEPFFTTKKEGRGTGLGLSTSYGVVHQAGGFLEVDSAPGMGSEFRVYLPLSKQDRVSEAVLAPGTPELSRDETILLAEDEPQVRALTERTLLRLGYRVLVAQNGAEAVEQSRVYPDVIHLLLTDVVMPVMGGVRAADTIRSERPGIRVIFVSGYSEESLFREGVDQGVNFLGKPFTPQELDRKVREVLDGVEVGPV